MQLTIQAKRAAVWSSNKINNNNSTEDGWKELMLLRSVSHFIQEAQYEF